MKPEPGDWIRFQKAGVLVLGEVAYVIKPERYPYELEAWTFEHGAVRVSDILEVRRKVGI